MRNCESGENEASNGNDFEFRCPVNVCRVLPEKASINLGKSMVGLM